MLLIALIGLSGCSWSWLTGRFQSPTVKLIDVKIVRARLTEQEFQLSIRLDNPNGFSLPVRGFKYRVQLNEINLADGQYNQWFNIPARGHKVLQIPVHTNLWRHIRYVVKLLESPDTPIQYRLNGEVKTGLLFGRRIQLNRTGQIIPGDYIRE